MTTTSRLLIFAGVLLLAAIALVPLRLVLPAGLSAAAARGTIWHGQLTDARWNSFGLGTLDVALHPLPLVAGEARLEVAGPALRGLLILGEGVEALSGTAAAAPPLASMSIDAVTLRFAGGRCTAASGRVSLTLLASPPPLSGSPRCNGAMATLPLASADGLVTTAATLSATGEVRLQ